MFRGDGHCVGRGSNGIEDFEGGGIRSETIYQVGGIGLGVECDLAIDLFVVTAADTAIATVFGFGVGDAVEFGRIGNVAQE